MERNMILKNIKLQMKRHELTQEEVADIIGVARQTFRRRLKHPEEFTVDELILLCRHFGISLKTLLK